MVFKECPNGKVNHTIFRYRIKEIEAEALNDFLLPLLKYYPNERCTAQESLKHPWLEMPNDYDYLMNDKEYNNMIIINRSVRGRRENSLDEIGFSQDTILSDCELNQADEEDNNELRDFEEEESESSLNENSSELIHTQNFNNSFSAYGQNINLAALDRPNPQFEALDN